MVIIYEFDGYGLPKKRILGKNSHTDRTFLQEFSQPQEKSAFSKQKTTLFLCYFSRLTNFSELCCQVANLTIQYADDII